MISNQLGGALLIDTKEYHLGLYEQTHDMLQIVSRNGSIVLVYHNG